MAPSERVGKTNENLYYIEEPVIMIHKKDLDNEKKDKTPRNITYRGILKYQSAGLILITSGYTKSFYTC